MLALRIRGQHQFRWKAHIELVIVPEGYVGCDLESVARVLAIFKVVISYHDFLEGGRACHHEFKRDVLNLNLATLIVSCFHHYGLGGLLATGVLKVLTSHSEGLPCWGKGVFKEIFYVEKKGDTTCWDNKLSENLTTSVDSAVNLHNTQG